MTIPALLRVLYGKLSRNGPDKAGQNWLVTTGATALFLERLARIGIGFFISAAVARYLGPVQFGVLNFGLALGAIGAGVAQLGLDSVVTRDCVRHPDQVATLLATCIILRSSMAVVFWVVSLIVFLISEDGGVSRNDRITIVVAAFTTFSSVASLPSLVAQARGRIWRYSSLALFVFAVACCFRFLFIHEQRSSIWFACVVVGEMFVSGIWSFIILSGEIQKKWRFCLDVAISLLKESWPLWVAAIAYLGYMRADQLLVSSISGPEQLGFYTAALRLTDVGSLVPLALSGPLLASFAGLLACPESLQREVRLYSRLSAVAGFGFTIAVVVLAPFVFQRIFGAGYLGAIPVARVLAFCAPVFAVGVVRNQVLISQGRTRFAMFTMLAGIIANVAINLLLIPRFGAVGAAWASLIAQSVALVLSTGCNAELRWLAKEQAAALLFPVLVLPRYATSLLSRKRA